MLDFMAGRDIAQLSKAVLDLTATAATNATILVEKGICTEEEWLAERTRSIAKIDQLLAGAREEKLAKLEAISPVAKALYEATGLDLSMEAE